MPRRSSAPSWWHRTTGRAQDFYNDVHDVARHEGLVAAVTLLNHRLAQAIQYKLLSLARPFRTGRKEASAPPDTVRGGDRPLRPGVLFVGYVEASLGLGVSLRGLIDSVAETDVPFAIFPFNVNVESRYVGPFRPERYDLDGRYRINVVETAADQLPLVLNTLGSERTQASYNILRTYWELPAAPEQWRQVLEDVDEIWAPNSFVADAFRPIFTRPISIVPPCVEAPTPAPLERASLGLRDGIFYFLFTFDYFSFPARKNPIGVLRAFQAAFPKGDERVGLIIKSTGSQSQFPEVRSIIASAARRDPRIVVMEKTMTQPEVMALIAGCDCYVSLHRSEGFGLGMVEAMLNGTPVIGTDFSGSTDFLSAETGYPVTYELRPVRRGEYVYAEAQRWAEPDLASAVAAMRAVLDDPESAGSRAAAGQAFVRNRYSRSAVGGIVSARLAAILAQLERN